MLLIWAAQQIPIFHDFFNIKDWEGFWKGQEFQTQIVLYIFPQNKQNYF